MGRLTRAETQERNRAKVLEAAREEFAERGFRDAKIDSIADRAGLTRGAVYSNFPGKRALYFAVLADLAHQVQPPLSTPAARDTLEAPPKAPAAPNGPATPAAPGPDRTAREALGAFARAWVARLPLTTDDPHGNARLGKDLMPEIAAEERLQLPFAQFMRLNAILLGLSLEALARTDQRMVKVAETVLTTLHGVSQMVATAPGFVEPFDAISVCEQLADLELSGGWPPPHMPWIAPARPVDEPLPWAPQPATTAVDAVRAEPARLAGDGVVAVLGLHRLEAIEEAVRAVPPGGEVTAVLVTSDPDELGPLARLAIADLRSCLWQAFPPSAWPRLQIVHDPSGSLAAAAGVAAVSDATEVAVRVESGRIIARADGRGACHAAASFVQENRRSPRLSTPPPRR
ncbi:TetR/AcrR family transcriptional regulator [Actinomadura sp. 6N118]|uniref:TetR/AcrR family transcriptional regulator n=1 Tax=Actinomadura sp. 6N118 TaxID=3375151 RepID=UPI0037B7E6AD